MHGFGVDGVGRIFPFSSFFLFSSTFFAFLRFSSLFFVSSERTGETTAIHCKHGEFHSDPVCTDPVQNFPQYSRYAVRIFSSETIILFMQLHLPHVSWDFPQYARILELYILCSCSSGGFPPPKKDAIQSVKVIWGLPAESPKRVSRTVQTLFRTGGNCLKRGFAPCKGLLWESHPGSPKTPFAPSLRTFGHFGCFDSCARAAELQVLSLYFVGLKKSPQKFLPIFPQNFPPQP